MKTKEELNELKEEAEAVTETQNTKPVKLSDEDMEQISGGFTIGGGQITDLALDGFYKK